MADIDFESIFAPLGLLGGSIVGLGNYADEMLGERNAFKNKDKESIRRAMQKAEMSPYARMGRASRRMLRPIGKGAGYGIIADLAMNFGRSREAEKQENASSLAKLIARMNRV